MWIPFEAEPRIPHISGGIYGVPVNGFNTIQGIRSFDPTIGAWTTPDAYQGVVEDPASQKSYIWNRSNPVSYSDPSGYLSTIQQSELQFYVGWAVPKVTGQLMPCTTFIEIVYKNGLGIDLQKMVNDAYSFRLWTNGYSMVGANPWGQHNPAADATNLHTYFSHAHETHAYPAGGVGLQPGDIIFMTKGLLPNDHVAMVDEVKDGHPVSVVESQGQDTGGIKKKPYSEFISQGAAQGMHPEDYARIPATMTWDDIASMVEDELSEGQMQTVGSVEFVGPISKTPY